MEVLSPSTSVTFSNSNYFSFRPQKTKFQFPTTNFKFSHLPHPKTLTILSSSSSSVSVKTTSSSTYSLSSSPLLSPTTTAENRHYMVLMNKPSERLNSKPEVINYYVKTLERVLGSEKDAQMCIYDVSGSTQFGFCCEIDEQTSRELAQLPDVLTVRPDPDFRSVEKDYTSSSRGSSRPLFPAGNTKHWLVQIDKPGVGVVTKAQMVDFYAQLLTKVLGNEKDGQMCIYHVSWQSNFGFCCELDEECARELTGVPGVLAVQLDKNFESDNKDYGGNNNARNRNQIDSPDSSEALITTKKLFVTGLSFYTSEKTLRAAFEGFGELVEVKIIMDKISKRSKGYAFVEYTTVAAASAALKEMNGKIINGWMIVVDVAKTSPPKYSRSSSSRQR